jgi:alpha-1,6-mannosyltransferase
VAALLLMVTVSVEIATSTGDVLSYVVPAGRRGFPHWMRGPLVSSGPALPLARFVTLVVAMSVAFLVVLAVAPRLPAWMPLSVVALLVAIFAAGPPLLSTDVFNYVAYARMGLHGINPYAHGTVAFQHDPSYPFVGHFWNNTPSAYGPLFTLGSYAVEPLGVAGAMWAFKGIAGAATLGCVALAWSCARLLDREPLRAALLIGLNPLVLIWGVGGGHNDALVALALLGGVWLILRRRTAVGSAVVTSAAAIKLSAGLVLPFLLIGVRPRRRAALGIALSALLLAGVGYLVFGSSLKGMSDALKVQDRYGWRLISVSGFLAHYLDLGEITHAARDLLEATFVAVSAALAVSCLWTRNWPAAAGWSTLLLLGTTGWVLPWYVLWLLPLAAVARARLLVPATLALTLVITGIWLTYYHAQHHRHHHVAAVREGARLRSDQRLVPIRWTRGGDRHAPPDRTRLIALRSRERAP